MITDRNARQDNVVSVVGTGEVRARANVMHVMLEVRTRGATAVEALQENNAREQAVRNRLRAIGVHEESIDTSIVTFLPAAGDGVLLPGTTEPQGFIAVRSIGVNSYLPEDEVADLPGKIALMLDEAAEAGAQAGARQQVNLAIFRSPCVSFGLDNDEAARTEALRRAMLSARTAAEEAAQSMGADLDDIVSTQILELGGLVQGRWAGSAFGVPGLDTPRSPEAGRVTVRAVVAATFRVVQSPRFGHDREHLSSARFSMEHADTTRSQVDRTAGFP